MVVYLDVLLSVNWVIDFLLLHATARLTRAPNRGGRLVLGAAVGAASCCVVLLPRLAGWLSALFKAASALAMTAAAFRWEGWRPLVRRTAVLFGLSAAVAGVATAVWWAAAPDGLRVINGAVYWDISPLMLIALAALAYALICLWARWTRRREPAGRQYRLRLSRAGKTVEIPALFDSGNTLIEPFSGAPAAVAEYAAVAALLPPEWDPARPLPPPGARLIPYSSVGGGGLLPAFRPERMVLVDERGAREVRGAYVAVCPSLGGGDCRALVGLDICEMGREVKTV